MPTAATPFSSQSRLKAQAGDGIGKGGGEAPEAQTLLASPFSPFPSLPNRTWLALGRAEAQEQLKGGGWGQSTKGKGPSAQGEEPGPHPATAPH